MIDAELRLDLTQLALGAIDRELQLARLEPDEEVAGAHFGPELHRHVGDDAGDFAADFGLIGGEQRAREIDLALHRDALHRRDLGGDGLSATAAATSASAGGRLTRSHPLAAGRGERERHDHYEPRMHRLLFLYATGATRHPRSVSATS